MFWDIGNNSTDSSIYIDRDWHKDFLETNGHIIFYKLSKIYNTNPVVIREYKTKELYYKDMLEYEMNKFQPYKNQKYYLIDKEKKYTYDLDSCREINYYDLKNEKEFLNFQKVLKNNSDFCTTYIKYKTNKGIKSYYACGSMIKTWFNFYHPTLFKYKNYFYITASSKEWFLKEIESEKSK